MLPVHSQSPKSFGAIGQASNGLSAQRQCVDRPACWSRTIFATSGAAEILDWLDVVHLQVRRQHSRSSLYTGLGKCTGKTP